MMRVSDYTIQSYPPRDRRFETVQGVSPEDLDAAFVEAVEEAGRDPGEAAIVAAQFHMRQVADLLRNSTWGAVLRAVDAQFVLKAALSDLGIEAPPAPAARPLN